MNGVYRIDSVENLDAVMASTTYPGRVQTVEASEADIVAAIAPWPDLKVRLISISAERFLSATSMEPTYTLPRDALMLYVRLVEVYGEPTYPANNPDA